MAYSRLNICVFLAFTLVHHILASNNKLSLRLINRRSIFPKPPPTSQTDDIRAPVLPDETNGALVVNISLGEPPVPQLLAMDTGSHVTWTRCNCDTCFHPEKSSTYQDIPSHAPPCTSFDYDALDGELLPCPYQVSYLDSSFSAGTLALETYTFITSDDGTVQVPNAVLGCAHETKPQDFLGVLGLVATTPYHLISRVGNKFSYCIGNISDDSYMYNALILGAGAIIQGDSTPMQVDANNHYVVSLDGISIGDTSLTLDPQEFQNNVIVDSGAMVTLLKSSAYKQLAAQITSLADRFFLKRLYNVRNAERHLCYAGDLEADLKGFPTVTLRLGGGAEFAMDVESLFRRTIGSQGFCMTIIEGDVNIIGIFSQQNYNLGYDVDAKSLSIQRIDCQLLEG